MYKKILLAAIVFNTIILSAHANISDTVNFIGDRKLLGIAEHVNLKKVVYQAALYCGREESDQEQPKDCLNNLEQEIVMKFVLKKKMSARSLWTLWQNGLLRNNSSNEIELHSDGIQAFEKILFRNVKKPARLQALRRSGDTNIRAMANDIYKFPYSANNNYESSDQLIFHYHPNRGVKFYWNGQLTGKISNGEVMPVLFSVWVGDRPPSIEFKDSILGYGTVDWNAANDSALRFEVSESMAKKAKSTLALEKKLLKLTTRLKKAQKSASNRQVVEKRKLALKSANTDELARMMVADREQELKKMVRQHELNVLDFNHLE